MRIARSLAGGHTPGEECHSSRLALQLRLSLTARRKAQLLSLRKELCLLASQAYDVQDVVQLSILLVLQIHAGHAGVERPKLTPLSHRLYAAVTGSTLKVLEEVLRISCLSFSLLLQ